MDKLELIERAKTFLGMLCKGVHPVLGTEIPGDSAFADEKVKNCFAFITETLNDYVALLDKVAVLEEKAKQQTVVLAKKNNFSITEDQCQQIPLSKEPLTVFAFMKNVNSVIDTASTEKLSSTRINQWLFDKGLINKSKVQTIVNKTVYTPTALATKIGIREEELVDQTSGEIKKVIKFDQSAQLFILENLQNVIQNT